MGSRQVARETIVFFMAAIEIVADESYGWSTFPDFVAHIHHLGRKLQEAGPKGKYLHYEVETFLAAS